uniref:Nuclear pore complex protein n=1 Tax=Hirondellea gigas TaxID=1518452 RepID=A0A2P2HXF4_9CRUS
MSRAALDESLARLDAALGVSPLRPHQRTPFTSASRQVMASNVTSMLDGHAFDTSLANTESPFGESMLGNGSFYAGEVTGPVLPALAEAADQTIDMTTAVLPAQHNAQVLFSEFVRVLVGEQCGSGQEGGVWGEVLEYETLCQQQAQHIEKIFRKMPRQHQASFKTRQMLQQLVGERNMWRLLRSLYLDRQCRSETPLDDAADMAGWLKSDQDVVTELYDASREIREGQLVVDWLEKSASEALQQLPEKLEHYTDSHVAWENTLRIVKASARGHGQGVGSERLISSVDPDAPVRYGKVLHDLDQEDERVLVRRVMLCLRSGQEAEAQDKCVASGQHWRAATMEGWKLHHDPNVMDTTKRSPVQGNPYRDVWKRLAWKASEDTRLSQYQRAMYGSLCGNLSAMLLVCNDWEDVLWAHARALVDQRVEEKLRMAHAHARPRSLVPLPKNYPEQRMSMCSVFTSVEKQSSSEGVKSNPYYVMCKHLILDDIDGLLAAAQCWLEDGPAPHLLRCLTHLLLVLKRIYRIVAPHQDDIANAVLHACVKAAMERGDVEQVAWYTAMLPSSQQVSCYAGFLLNITDPPQRRHALHLAQTVGLDTHTIATTTAAMIRLSPGGSLGESEGLVGDTAPSDRIRIAGLDWLLFDDELRHEALIQGLALLRTFLISRKITAANITIDKLPSDTLSMVGGDDKDPSVEVEAAVREYLCIKTFLSAQESFSDWFDHYHQQKPTVPPVLPVTSTFTDQIAHDHATLQYEAHASKWQATLDRLTKISCERLYNVLLFPDGGWMVDPVPLPHTRNSSQSGDCGTGSTSGQRLQHLSPELAAREPDRDHQLVTLRSIYIPQVCSLLQSILSSTDQHKQCLQLSDVIASEQHQLFTAFGSSEMQRFLLKMTNSSRHLLDNDKDALGYPLQ